MAHRRTVREALDTRGLTRSHIDNGSNARFQGSRAIFQLFPRRTINLQLSKLASSVSRVSIQHRCISSTGLAWMVQNKPPSREASASHRFAAPRRVAMTSIFDRRALAAAAALSPGRASRGFTVRFCGLHSSCYLDCSEGDRHARCENTSLQATPRDSTDAPNFTDVLEGQTQVSVCWASWWPDVTRAPGRAGPWASPSSRGFPPREPRWPVSTRLQGVLTVPARNGRKCYRVGAVASFSVQALAS